MCACSAAAARRHRTTAQSGLPPPHPLAHSVHALAQGGHLLQLVGAAPQDKDCVVEAAPDALQTDPSTHAAAGEAHLPREQPRPLRARASLPRQHLQSCRTHVLVVDLWHALGQDPRAQHCLEHNLAWKVARASAVDCGPIAAAVAAAAAAAAGASHALAFPPCVVMRACPIHVPSLLQRHRSAIASRHLTSSSRVVVRAGLIHEPSLQRPPWPSIVIVNPCGSSTSSTPCTHIPMASMRSRCTVSFLSLTWGIVPTKGSSRVPSESMGVCLDHSQQLLADDSYEVSAQPPHERGGFMQGEGHARACQGSLQEETDGLLYSGA
eukprot:1152935-Pelagomonas_calceolata.AAC.2